MTKKCLKCARRFQRPARWGRKKWEKRKYCSPACRYSHAPKNPQYRRKLSEALKGHTFSAEGRAKLSEAQKGASNSNWKGGLPKCLVCKKTLVNYKTKHCKAHQPPSNWQGENASYVAKHQWIRRHRGKPQKCEHCGTTEKRMYHWANISGEYKREFADYISLCVPCHSKYDRARH